MYKVCKSCGAEIKSNVCKKCGYGEPLVETSVILPKTKKEITKKSKIIIVIFIIVAVVVSILYKSEIIFNGDGDNYKKPINTFFSSLKNNDYDEFVGTVPKQLEKDYDIDREECGLSKDEYMKTYYDDSAIYGDGYTISVEYLSAEKNNRINLDDFELQYKEIYDDKITIRDGYEVSIAVTYKGSISEITEDMIVSVIKIGRHWYIADFKSLTEE